MPSRTPFQGDFVVGVVPRAEALGCSLFALQAIGTRTFTPHRAPWRGLPGGHRDPRRLPTIVPACRQCRALRAAPAELNRASSVGDAQTESPLRRDLRPERTISFAQEIFECRRDRNQGGA